MSILILAAVACAPQGTVEIDGADGATPSPDSMPSPDSIPGADRAPVEGTKAPAAPETSVVHGTAPPATGEFASVVVLIRTDPGAASSTSDMPPERREIMDQFGMAFVPAVILARSGQPVEFRNSEDVIHNVNATLVESTDTVFNVGTIPGGSYLHVFETPGVYSVRCNVHATMSGYVFVADSPYATVADRDGAFSIVDVPYGSYVLSTWNADGRERAVLQLEVERPETAVGPIEAP